ncbi:MAG: amidohydrolase family protein [Acidobacteriota bacterium]
MNRRQWLSTVGTALAVPAAAARIGTAAAAAQQPAPTPMPLELKDFQPRSMLKVPVTRVARARFPVIDFHTHLGFRRGTAGVPQGEEVRFSAPAAELLQVMDAVNLQTMVNLTGGVGSGLAQSIERYQSPHPGRFVTFTEPRYAQLNEPNYAREQAADVERAHQAGARGLKVLKTLGLYLRERITSGPLVAIDDSRFDPMWEACAGKAMPVAIHVSDPEAFFLATDRFNERFEELNNHPDWSFHGRDFPSNRQLLEARNRMFARHPKTTFVALHVGHNAEDLGYVSECLDRYPNMNVEIGARIGELGRQPRNARRFFDRYQDRILFGTDAIPHGTDTPQQVFNQALYEIYFRFLETEDEYFDYAPAPTPPQGRWRIYGVGLPEPILRKVYRDNAARLLGLS